MEKEILNEPKIVFHIVNGAENMKRNKILSSDYDGQLYKMHKISVPSLKSGLEDRWMASEKANKDSSGQEYYAAFIEKDGEVVSMISGTYVNHKNAKQNGSVFVQNVITSEKYRRKGYMQFLLKEFAEYIHDNYPQIEKFHALMSSGISRNAFDKKEINEFVEQVNELSNNPDNLEIDDDKAKKYGSVMGRSVEATKKLKKVSKLEGHENETIYDLIPENISDNIKVFNNINESIKGESKMNPHINIGQNYNFIPFAELRNSSVNKIAENERLSFQQNRRSSFREKNLRSALKKERSSEVPRSL